MPRLGQVQARPAPFKRAWPSVASSVRNCPDDSAIATGSAPRAAPVQRAIARNGAKRRRWMAGSTAYNPSIKQNDSSEYM